MYEFKLPELGENIAGGTVVNINVAVGDTVKKEQELFELETDKASLPIPSPVAGTIKEILIKKGEDVKVGSIVMKLEAADTAKSTDKPAQSVPEKEPAVKPTEGKESATSRHPVPTSSGESVEVGTPITINKTENIGDGAPATEGSISDSQNDKTSSQAYDTQLVVIGGGPGGYAAAFYAADLGMKTTLVDLDVNPGGVCLFRGCIPSKALLHAAKVLSEAREAQNFGIEFGQPKVNLNKLRDWKNGVVKQLTGGLGVLAKQRKVTFIQGRASFVNSNTISIEKSGGEKQTLTFDKAILATGSRPITLPGAPESEKIMDSTSALDIKDVPKSLLLVGGGYIGLELGIVYAELGSDIDVVEMLPQLMTGADRDIAGVLEKRLEKLFKNIMVSTKITKTEITGSGIKVTFEDKDGKSFTKEYEKLLVAIGRKPNSENLGLDKTKVKVTDRGFVEVNAQRLTTDPSIYAIGDIAGQPMLAHKASHEGRVAVEAIAGHKVAFEPIAIPAVVFTDPEIAWAGLTETEAKQKGIEYEVAKFPWGASGRAITLDRTDGLTKMLIDPKTERILGISIVGPGAGELIAEGVLALEMGAVVSDLKLSIHPHPTLTETVMEAAESFYGHATHVYRPKKK